MLEFYLEILEFLHSCGGTYSHYHSDTGNNVLRAIHSGGYVYVRDDGNLTGFICYEMNNNIMTILEHGSKGTIRVMIKALRKMEPNGRGLKYYHRYKGPGLERYFPSQRGKL